MAYLTKAQLARALTLADLTDPAHGPHCMQQVVAAATGALRERWGCPVLVHRAERVVPVADNYDALGYPPDGPARDSRYTRYVDAGRLLRSQTSAAIPSALRALARAAPDDVLVCAPGLVYRRDAIDRLHVGEPHQLDLWRVSSAQVTEDDLEAMIAAVVKALLPGARWRATAASHPYTLAGREVEVLAGGEWVELLECGLAHPDVLGAAGLRGHRGLAMGIGLDRAVMLRKGVADIRLLRSPDPRVTAQMRDLAPYAPVSTQPPARRDVSVACPPGWTDEDLGDRVRDALGAEASEWVEEVALISRTPASDLPAAARSRLGIADGQENLLVRVVLRHPTRSLAKPEANALRDRIYAALHQGCGGQQRVTCRAALRSAEGARRVQPGRRPRSRRRPARRRSRRQLR
jgi:phenylalanyl-tRNA synthetase alpha chain